MTALTSSLVVRLLDQVTGPAKKVGTALAGLDKTARRSSIGERMGAAMERNNAALDQTRGRVVDAFGGILLLRQGLTSTIGPAVAFESALADIAKVSGFDTKGLDAYGKRLRDLAVNEIPMAIDDLASLSAEAAAAGVADADLFDFTKLTAKAAVAWEMTGKAAGENLAKITSALGLTNEQTASYADAINHVSDNLAATAPDMLDFSRRVAVQGEFFGYTKEQTLAFGGAMVSAGAQSEVAATSFRNMGRALTKGTSATKRQAAAFQKIGMSAPKVAKAMQKDAVGTTLKVIEALGKLPEHMQAAYVSDLFGDEAQALTPLLKNTELLRKALALTAEETAYSGSVNAEFAKRAETTAYAMQRFQNQMRDLALSIGGAMLPGLKDLMGALGPVVLRLAKLADEFPAVTSGVVAVTTGLVGLKVAMIGVKWAALMARGGLLGLALPIAKLGKWAKDAVVGAVGLQAALAGMSGTKMTGLQTVGTAISGLLRAIPGMGLVTGAISAIVGALGAITAPIVAGIVAVGAAGLMIWKYWDRISSVFAGVGMAIADQLAPAIEAIRPALDWLAPISDTIAAGWAKASQAFSDFSGYLGSFFSQEVLSEEEKSKWASAGHDAATKMIEAIKSVFSGIVEWAAGIGSRIGEAIGGRATAAINRVKGWFGASGEGMSIPSSTPPVGQAPASAPVSGHRAKGGPVWPGGSFLVGEHEPEIFTPKSGGTITPSSQMGGAGPITINMTVNGVSDPMQAAQAASRLIESKLNDMLRGAHADTGARF